MKLLKGKTPEPKTEGRLVALPVRLCEPHPDLQTRLKYDQVDALADDIKVHGQLQPGRAVERPDGTGYWVYMGIGRLLAIKKLLEREGEPRSYYALLDEGLPFIELFSRSMSENLKRRNLSVLEEVTSFYLASKRADEEEIVAASSKIGEEPSAVRRRIELAKVLEGRLERLYDIEAHASFAFQIGHLEALARVEGEKELYEAAAAAAHSRFSVKELQVSLKNKSIDKVESGLPAWFYEVFPEYAKGAEQKATAEVSLPTDMIEVQHGVMAPVNPKEVGQPGSPALLSKETNNAVVSIAKTEPTTTVSQPPAGVAYKGSLHFAKCPHCGAMAPFELKEDSELTLIRFRGTAVPEKEAVAPEGSYRALRTCFNPECRGEFWVWAAWVGKELRAETRRKGEEGWFTVPNGKTVVGAVSWDLALKSWVVKESGSGKAYAYGEDGKFVGI